MRVETSFDLVGDLIGVDAVVVGPTGRAQVQLILDTGAVMTTVVPSVADSIGYSSALRVGWTVTRTAAAEERGYIVRSEVSTLGFTVPDLRIVIADLGYGIEGVLGMDFLRLFNLEIRPAEPRILVEKIGMHSRR
ncbi:MAG TPA: retropepsin-like aspartic protease [Kofleriaceae bacterium]|nr:retropepsin-like aspartic protease [Kofleriaceae bacterium]